MADDASFDGNPDVLTATAQGRLLEIRHAMTRCLVAFPPFARRGDSRRGRTG